MFSSNLMFLFQLIYSNVLNQPNIKILYNVSFTIVVTNGIHFTILLSDVFNCLTALKW